MRKVFGLLFICSFVTTIIAKPLELELNSNNAILINADNNKILYEKNAHQLAYPASVTKMLSILYVVDNFSQNLSKYYTGSATALKVVSSDSKIASDYKMPAYLLESDGSSFDIQLNERLTLNDLLHGMVICSGNDASNVIAENIGGSIENFMKNLNDYLKKNGCLNTNLCNPHGLHYPSHVTTVYDIAHMMRLGLKNPKFLEIFSCKNYVRPKTNKQPKKEMFTYNKILKSGKHHYKWALCSKTGYHAKAKYNLLTVAKKDDRTLIAVVFGSPTNEGRYEDTKKLFEKAFAEKKVTKTVLEKDNIFNAKVVGGSKNLKASMQEDLTFDYYPSEEGPMKALIVWDNLKAPIKKGEKVGTINLVTNENEILKKQNIYAGIDVKRSMFFALCELFKKK